MYTRNSHIDTFIVYKPNEEASFAFVVTNMRNAIISSRPGIISAPRSFVLRFDYKF